MILVLFLALVSFASIVIYSLRFGITPMPSSKKAQDAMILLLPLTIEKGVIYELGSGWGGLAFRLAKEHPKAKVIAIELSPIPYLFSRARQLLDKRANLIILRKSFYDQNLSDAKAVLCYLFPGAMRKLSLKLKQELPNQCTIISNTFSLINWENTSVIFLDDLSATPIYKYTNNDRLCPKVVAKRVDFF